MSRSLQFASFVPGSGMSCAIVAAMFLVAGSFSLLRGQSSATNTDPGTAAALPATPAPAATDSSSKANAAAPTPDPGSQASAFGRDQGPSLLPASSRSAGANSRQWSRSMLDPFEPGPNFGNFSGSSGGGMGFTGTGSNGTGRFGERRAGAGGMGMGGRQGASGPLFPDGGGIAGGSNSLFGPAPSAMPSLNQLMRGSFNVPFSSSTSSLRFAYQDVLRLGGNPGELARPSTSMMFSTSDLGNGVFFSAGTSYGRSMAGSPAASLGSNASAAGKHSGPSVALKLSF